MTGPPLPDPPARAPRGLPAVSPQLFRRLVIASLAAVCLIVVTGAAVRLTGSGLGCPNWPSCTHQHLTPALSFHPVIEFANRMVTVLLTIVVGATVLGALRRRPYRRDLLWLAVGLLIGVLAQAGLGGLVVYTKLNPYLVMVHFLLSMAIVADAVVLLHRSNRRYGPDSGQALVGRSIRLGSRGLVGLLAIVLAAGTATTGAGPHAGSSQGQVVAKRIPIALRDMAELHSSLALLLVGLTLGLVVALHASDVPERVRRAGRILMAVLIGQAAIGYTQYFTHLPAAVVEIHVLGATALVVGIVQFFLALTHHPIDTFDAARRSSDRVTTSVERLGAGSLVASSAGAFQGTEDAPIV
ncbi:MAG TPA: COX15/CtaA family protein [Acidimicrobiales bacterium]|nr:COX15/CtaA family protein [Acidimicrobiales bacterium]